MPAKHKKVSGKNKILGRPLPNIVPPISLPPPTGLVPTNYYRNFLNNFVVGQAPANFPQATVDTWPNVNLTTLEGKITNDIAKKFHQTQQAGIDNVYRVTGTTSDMYGTDSSSGNNRTYLNLHNRIQPTVIGHELIHANDHQTDNLNAQVWRHLQTLYNNVNVGIPNFSASVGRIQDKIDPTQDFKVLYPLDRDEEVGNINKWEKYVTQPKIPKAQRFTPSTPANDWTSTFPQIQRVVAAQNYNKPFLSSYASEFPAHMSERLHLPWGMGKNIPDPNTPGQRIPNPNRFTQNPNPNIPNPKSYNVNATGAYTINPQGMGTHIKNPNRSRSYERNFVSSVLGDMGTAYPDSGLNGPNDYPNMHQAIQDRIDETNYRTGGHVTRPRQKCQSNFDMERAIQILEMLSRAMV